MIDRITGFFKSLNHFFQFFNGLMEDMTYFVPMYIQGALAMLLFFAFVVLAVKLVKGILEVIKTILTSIFFFI